MMADGKQFVSGIGTWLTPMLFATSWDFLVPQGGIHHLLTRNRTISMDLGVAVEMKVSWMTAFLVQMFATL